MAKGTVYRFQDRALAFSFSDRSVKSSAVILGDDGLYWVVSMADAARLERSGYSWA